MDIGARRGSASPLRAIQSPSDHAKPVVLQTIDAVDGRSSARNPTGSDLSGSSVPCAPMISYL